MHQELKKVKTTGRCAHSSAAANGVPSVSAPVNAGAAGAVPGAGRYARSAGTGPGSAAAPPAGAGGGPDSGVGVLHPPR
ncbi:hypothetical protein KBX53_10315, partial [Micromonospora sp. M51]|nr:hypothetical protein [Micromonospora sp. M51]